MMERLQYVLILLLFVLTGSLEGAPLRSDAADVQPSLTRFVIADSHDAPVRNFLSVAICSCEASIEAPAVSHDHKAVVRSRSDARTVADAAFGVRTAMCTYSPFLHGKAVDYYVFTLGRILI